jgi:peptide/nickel transport system ATP-binding protein
MTAPITQPSPVTAPGSEPLLSVTGLSVRFHTDEGPIRAVDDLSFTVGNGEIVALVGESGCGKSMTAMSILNLLPPGAQRGGSIRLAGRELTSLTAKQMRSVRGRDVSVIFQEPMTSLNPSFTIGFQIGEVLRRHEGLGRAQARARAVELLDLVRIPAPARRVDEYPHQLSGGMRQRVMIAIALACTPKLLIADEPTTALDVTIQAQILEILKDLQARLGMSVIIITHDLGVVADIADRVVVMYAGHKIESAATDALFADPQHPYTIGLLGAVPRPDLLPTTADQRLQEIPGMVPIIRAQPTNCVFAPRCARADAHCRSAVPPLVERHPGQLVACFHPGPEESVPTRPSGTESS